MLAISSGFRLERSHRAAIRRTSKGIRWLTIAPFALLLMGIPSITYKGWLLPLADRLPRRITFTEPPTPEALGEIVNPATLPFSEFIRLSVFTVVNCSPLTCCVAYVSDFSDLRIPNAVITTCVQVALPHRHDDRHLSLHIVPTVTSLSVIADIGEHQHFPFICLDRKLPLITGQGFSLCAPSPARSHPQGLLPARFCTVPVTRG